MQIKKIYFILLIVMLIGAACESYSQGPDVQWAESLEFQYGQLQTPLQTGTTGNVYLIYNDQMIKSSPTSTHLQSQSSNDTSAAANSSDTPQTSSFPLYSVEAIHNMLREEFNKHSKLPKKENGPNYVIGGLTLFQEIPSQASSQENAPTSKATAYFAVFDFLRHGRCLLAFKSGIENEVSSSEKNKSTIHDNGRYYIVTSRSHMHHQQTGQENFIFRATAQSIQGQLDRLSDVDIDVISEQEDTILSRAKRYWKLWIEKHREYAQRLSVEIRRALLSEQLLESNFQPQTIHDLLKPLQELLHGQIYQDVHQETQSHSFGFCDSEQLFLVWLRWEYAKRTHRASFVDRMVNLSEQLLTQDSLVKHFSHEEIEEKMPQILNRKKVKEAKQRNENTSVKDLLIGQKRLVKKNLGVLIHLHSYREMCLSCAASIAMEFYGKQIRQLKQHENDKFFIYVMVSSDTSIKPSGKHISERYKAWGLDDELNNRVKTINPDKRPLDLDSLLQNEIVVQRKPYGS